VHQMCPNPAQKAAGAVLAGTRYVKAGDQYATEHSLFGIRIA